MEFRDILVHVPDPDALPRHLVHAARLARLFDARLTGIQPIEPYPPFAISDAPAVTIALQKAVSEQVERAHAGATAFAARAAELGVEAAEWKVAEAGVGPALAYAGAWHDVLVLGAVGGSVRSSPQVVAEAVVRSRMPCLVVPERAADSPLALDTIAIGWNASIESIRAVHAALPLLARAKRVVMLCGRPRDYSGSMPRPPAFDLDMYLSRHGVRPERANVDTADTEAGHVLLDRATAEGAGLLVMGAYGRTRFSEWALGGATRDSIVEGALPLFLHH